MKPEKKITKFLLVILILGLFLTVTPLYPPLQKVSSQAGKPYAMTINHNVHKLYIANWGAGSVTVGDLGTNTFKDVSVGTNPSAVATNPKSNKTYVANWTSNTVSVIDAVTDAKETDIGVGTNPCAIVVNPVTNRIYVACFNANRVDVINGESQAFITSINVGINPRALAVNPMNNRIFVANYGSSTVSVINGNTNAILTTLTVGSQPYAITLDVTNNKIFVANYMSNNISIIDGGATPPSVVATLAPPGATNPYAIAVNPDTHKVYVANWTGNNISVIDGTTNSVITVIPVPALSIGTNPSSICVNSNTNMIFFTTYNSTISDPIRPGKYMSVGIINGNNDTLEPYSLSADKNANCLAIDPSSNDLYVTGYNGSYTLWYSGAGILSTLSVGTTPSAAAVNEITNKTYLANEGSNTVSVIRGSDYWTTPPTIPSIEATIPVGTAPKAIAVNPITNKIYVANSGSNNVSVINGATNAVESTIGVGNNPLAIAVNINPSAGQGRVYIANTSDNTVTVINTDNTTNLINMGGNAPVAIAINPNTDRIYVVNRGSNNVTVINGVTNELLAVNVPVGLGPSKIVANPITNKAYVSNTDEATAPTVTLIDETLNNPSSITVGANPSSMSINYVTNTIYVADTGAGDFQAIRDDSVASTITMGASPNAVAISLNLNKAYVTASNTSNMTIQKDIWSQEGQYQILDLTETPIVLEHNNLKYATYITTTSSNVIVLDDSPFLTPNATVSINQLSTDNKTTSTRPTLSGAAINSRTPNNVNLLAIKCQIDTTQGAWEMASMTPQASTSVNWSYTPSQPLTCGLHTLYVVPIDVSSATIDSSFNNSGNTSNSSYTGPVQAYQFLVYDNEPPRKLDYGIRINDDEPITYSKNVTLSLLATDNILTTEMKLACRNDTSFTDADFGGWISYNTQYPYTLTPQATPNVGQKKYVAVKFRDAALNESPIYSDDITLFEDTIPPTGSVSINNGATYASNNAVNLTLSAYDSISGVSSMIVANDSSFVGQNWENYATSKSWTLVATPNGEKKVWVKYKDKVGNTSSPYNAAIFIDTIKPTNPSVSINGGASVTGSLNVTLSLYATDNPDSNPPYYASGMGDVVVSNDSSFSDASWTPYITSKAWTFSEVDPGSIVTVYAKFRDKAGNETDAVNSSISYIPPKEITRLYGDTRYETAVEISKKGWTTSDYVILSRGDLYPDALAGAPLAAKYNAPILLTWPGDLNDSTLNEIKRLHAKKVVVLGSEDAVYPHVVSDLITKANITSDNIVRIGGDDRYDTASMIATSLGTTGNQTAIIATGLDYPDALAAASLAAWKQWPILLVGGDFVKYSTVAALKTLQVLYAIMVGGERAVTPNIEAWLTDNKYVPSRLGGADRYETAKIIADYSLTQGMKGCYTFLATGENFPDALASGPLACKKKAPILLCTLDLLPDPTVQWLTANKANIYLPFIAGGSDVVSDLVKEQVYDIIK